ncbi:MAG: hypothetical protein WDN00_05465 [Limisphaerales bacterium]
MRREPATRIQKQTGNCHDHRTDYRETQDQARFGYFCKGCIHHHSGVKMSDGPAISNEFTAVSTLNILCGNAKLFYNKRIEVICIEL